MKTRLLKRAREKNIHKVPIAGNCTGVGRTAERGGGVLIGLVMVLTLAGCAPAMDIAKARGQLDEHMSECTVRHSYDPEAASDLGPYVLGVGEREWRECVYQGVEKYLVPNTLTPEVYRQVIAEDREMTNSIAAGRMTRSQRKARVQALLEEIERREEANKVELERRMQAAEQAMKEELRRQQEMMRITDMRRAIGPLSR